MRIYIYNSVHLRAALAVAIFFCSVRSSTESAFDGEFEIPEEKESLEGDDFFPPFRKNMDINYSAAENGFFVPRFFSPEVDSFAIALIKGFQGAAGDVRYFVLRGSKVYIFRATYLTIEKWTTVGAEWSDTFFFSFVKVCFHFIGKDIEAAKRTI